MSVLSWGANPHAILSFNASFQNQPTSPSIYLLLPLDINVFLLYILIKSYLFTFRFWEIPFPAPQLCEFCWSFQRNLLSLYLVRRSQMLACKNIKEINNTTHEHKCDDGLHLAVFLKVLQHENFLGGHSY